MRSFYVTTLAIQSRNKWSPSSCPDPKSVGELVINV